MKHWGRVQLRANPVLVLILTMATLTVTQSMTSDLWYAKFSIAMTVLVFAFKSWVNFVFAITTHRQKGETDLSKSMEKYFWALLSQSIIFSLLFLMGFADMMGWPTPLLEWAETRNFVRNLGITSIIAVIIFGEHALEDLMTYIRNAKAETVDERDIRQTRQQRVLDLTSLSLTRRGERLSREEERRAKQGD
jgi:hypothetical protein